MKLVTLLLLLPFLSVAQKTITEAPIQDFTDITITKESTGQPWGLRVVLQDSAQVGCGMIVDRKYGDYVLRINRNNFIRSRDQKDPKRWAFILSDGSINSPLYSIAFGFAGHSLCWTKDNGYYVDGLEVKVGAGTTIYWDLLKWAFQNEK